MSIRESPVEADEVRSEPDVFRVTTQFNRQERQDSGKTASPKRGSVVRPPGRRSALSRGANSPTPQQVIDGGRKAVGWIITIFLVVSLVIGFAAFGSRGWGVFVNGTPERELRIQTIDDSLRGFAADCALAYLLRNGSQAKGAKAEAVATESWLNGLNELGCLSARTAGDFTWNGKGSLESFPPRVLQSDLVQGGQLAYVTVGTLISGRRHLYLEVPLALDDGISLAGVPIPVERPPAVAVNEFKRVKARQPISDHPEWDTMSTQVIAQGVIDGFHTYTAEQLNEVMVLKELNDLSIGALHGQSVQALARVTLQDAMDADLTFKNLQYRVTLEMCDGNWCVTDISGA